MKTLRTILMMSLVLFMAACEPSAEQGTEDGEMADTTEATETAATMESPDTTGAALWAHMQEAKYQESWQLWPGKEAYYEGTDPHGRLLTTYLNETALAALNGDAAMMPEGAIVVKENYMPDSTLAAITVMHKVAAGYNPDHNDWFFAKFQPSGALEMAPDGSMALEGRVPGCQACHGQQKDNDYLFTGMLR